MRVKEQEKNVERNKRKGKKWKVGTKLSQSLSPGGTA